MMMMMKRKDGESCYPIGGDMRSVCVCGGGGREGASKSECLNVIVSKLSYVGEGYPDGLLTFS